MAKIGSIVGSTGLTGISLTRDQAPWTYLEVEMEYKGNWMFVTEAWEEWWVKQVSFRVQHPGLTQALRS